MAGLFFFCHRLVSSLLHCELGVLVPSGGCVPEIEFPLSPTVSCSRLCPVSFRTSVFVTMLECVDHFTCLGSVISKDGDVEKEVNTPLAKAATVFISLDNV